MTIQSCTRFACLCAGAKRNADDDEPSFKISGMQITTLVSSIVCTYRNN